MRRGNLFDKPMESHPSARTPVDLSRLGPPIGQLVPNFHLKDQTGEWRDLQSVMGPNGAMLVFIRSADW